MSTYILFWRRLGRGAFILRSKSRCLQNQLSCVRSFSASTADPKKSSLSDRMSFLFEQIEALERERAEKDNTLQRIRTWHQSKDNLQSSQEDRKLEPEFRTFDDSRASVTHLKSVVYDATETESAVTEKENCVIMEAESCAKDGPMASLVQPDKECLGPVKTSSDRSSGLVVEMAHPWPEWIELMERLVQHNYFDHMRKDEDRMVEDLGLSVSGSATNLLADELGVDFNDIKSVQNACLNFGKDRFDILRAITRRDIQVLVGYGCPNTDRKVVFSTKLLRKYAHIDEGDVCSNCSMRGSCEKAFLLPLKEDEARTVDLMRVLLAYGLDHSFQTVTNKSLAKHKSLRTVVRKILHEVLKLSSTPIDPNLPRPVIKRPPPKVKQPPPTAKKRVGRSDVDMKKGDWVCPKCDFMNFAKNTVCLQCDAKRPKRQLLPGEWECPQCNFLNYRRNMVCFHCECKRPQDDFVGAMIEERQRVPGTDSGKAIKRSDVSNAWNFDFDDDESDGADVAAFEYADSAPKHAGNHSVDGQVDWGSLPQHDADPSRVGARPGLGFDDFDDDYDIDSYEVDSQNGSRSMASGEAKHSYVQMSDLEVSEGSESDDHPPSKSRIPARKPSRRVSKRDGIRDRNSDSDDDFSSEPMLRSSHVADTKYRTAGRGQKTSSRKLRFVSDEMDLSSDDDDDDEHGFSSRSLDLGKKMTRRRNPRSSDSEDSSSFSGSDSDGDLRFGSGRKKPQRDFERKSGKDRMLHNRPWDKDRNNDTAERRTNMRSSRVQFAQNERFPRRSSSRDTEANFRGPRRETNGKNSWSNEFEKSTSDRFSERRGKPLKSDNFMKTRRGVDREADSGEFRNSRRVIER